MADSGRDDLIERARAVIPGGMYGHQDRRKMWPGAPQFLVRGDGPYIWDAEGKRYIDLMCSYGPILHGHRHPQVEAAAAAQAKLADCQNTPAAVMVALAERMVDVVDHADWAMFMKNGTDATTLALTIARAATGKKAILVAQGAYHGAAPWCNPNMLGVVPGDRANLHYYVYNDSGSVDRLLDVCGDDLAAIIVSPFRHDAGFDQELVDPAFARHLRAVCDRRGAALILDDVRCGFRLHFGGSWEPLGVRPDLSSWSKAMGNGYPIAALLGADALRDAASRIFATGSFWFSAVPMAASLATLAVLEEEDGVARMHEMGERLVQGLRRQARTHGHDVNVTGHPTMPYLTFAGETDRQTTQRFAAECAARGLYLHPRHNWFLSTPIDEGIMDRILDITDAAFAAVR